MKRDLHIAIPAMDELDFLTMTLNDISRQETNYAFTVYICVNQPDNWWNDPQKSVICKNNQQLLYLLEKERRFPLKILDFSTQGKGWKGKNYGVGWARKILFDFIIQNAEPHDIIISLDADTRFSPLYFQSVGENFSLNDIEAVSIPYYHKLTGNERADRAILRYEIYMRNYAINMSLIRSPYNFTAIGSAMAFQVKILKKIGGMTPMKSGEDFYLLQKIRKTTSISNKNNEMVYPAARFSSRVFFGTGPAMIKGDQGDWESYPVYHYSLFQEVKKTYDALPIIFTTDIDLPFIHFLKEQYKEENIWRPLRKNFKELHLFQRAFHEKADGLRILQYLKMANKQTQRSDEQALIENLHYFMPNKDIPFLNTGFDFNTLSILELNQIRDLLFELEMEMRVDINN